MSKGRPLLRPGSREQEAEPHPGSWACGMEAGPPGTRVQGEPRPSWCHTTAYDSRNTPNPGRAPWEAAIFSALRGRQTEVPGSGQGACWASHFTWSL